MDATAGEGSHTPLPVTAEATEISHVVGVGFGPSNLALAIAIAEHNAKIAPEAALRALFVERQATFGWHRGMLLDGATMQVAFLKDLVTLRNPESGFSFLSYLHAVGRLVDFINHKTMYPSRVEFHDYLAWAAARLGALVLYDSEVREIRPVFHDDVVDCLDVVINTAAAPSGSVVRRTRNVVLGVGLEPYLPDGVENSDRVWHNHDLLTRLETLRSRQGSVTPPGRFVVVGAGQSAAETTEYLHRSFPDAEVCAVFSRYGYSPADDSPFANRIFDPNAVDEFFHAPAEVKSTLFDYHRNTNYSVVDTELIEELYRRAYQEEVSGRRRLRILKTSSLVGLSTGAAGVQTTVEFLPTGEKTVLDADVVVFATGYRPRDPIGLLGELAPFCRTDSSGRLMVDRDYRVVTDPELTCGIYLQGGTEHTHGISSSLLSNVAVRSGEILHSITAHGRRGDPGVERSDALSVRALSLR
ncbi:lysine N(6)-hydroxylase/L-ornithine N(5)-oxygenase family protein [Candidatus Protofrankia californiensis]|uniref:lysine N(6)-hydroxylase/L-ornithine N(5)-oxygenase family protein n=1 Tax=Candidatus Protofrankia californiensis TaxID=1839754 RepID=UPI0010418536|nr:SidA/IucD/PvdA family monooxygenase [Candidatus Protofrankia californiensis]